MGLAAVALPILIHLFTRARAKPVPFSSLRFLQQLQNRKIRQVKLRQILLLILRTLIVLLLVLAFARPTCRSRSAASASARTSAVVILDNSLSMALTPQGESLLTAARKQAAAIPGLMRPGDELYLCSAADTTATVERGAIHDFQLYNQRLQSMTLDYGAADLSAALQFATRLLASAHNVNKEIYLLSDMQASSFKLDSLPRPPPPLAQFALPISGGQAANMAVTAVKLNSAILQQGRQVEIEVTLANSSAMPGRGKLVQLFLAGERVAQSTVSLEAGATIQERFRFIVDRRGWIDGMVQLEDDALSEDNQRFFSFYVPERLAIGMVGEPGEGIRLLELALRSAADSSGYLDLHHATAERTAALPLDSLQLVLLYDVAGLSGEAVSALAEWRRQGGNLLMVAGKRLDLRWYNQELAPALQLPRVLEAVAGGGSFTLGRIDASHPLLSGMFTGVEANFSRPQYNFALRFAPGVDQQVIFAYGTGDPALLELRGDGGARLLFSSSFEPEVSDIAFKTIFAPLLYRSVSYLAAQTENRGGQLVREPLRCRLPAEVLQEKLEIIGPDGVADQVRPQITPSGPWIDYREARRPGTYRLLAGGRVLMIWAVNIDPAELELSAAPREKVEEAYHMHWVAEPAQLARSVREARIGREYWKQLLALALALLIVEMAIYREKGQPEDEA